jgi:hypothetical protein
VFLRLLGRVAAAVCPLARLAMAAAEAADDVDKQSDSVVGGTHYRTKPGAEECRLTVEWVDPMNGQTRRKSCQKFDSKSQKWLYHTSTPLKFANFD